MADRSVSTPAHPTPAGPDTLAPGHVGSSVGRTPVATFVVVRAAVAPMHAEPAARSPQVSQALAGHVLLVHAEEHEWLRVAGVDAYPGWLHRGYTDLEQRDGLVEARTAPPRAVWGPPDLIVVDHAENRRSRTLSLGCTVSRAGARRQLPLGALVEDVAADGSAEPPEAVESGSSVPLDRLAARFPAEAGAVADSASTLFAGASYLWGGVTPWGADCSGFVQSIYRLHGCQLPRDAWQQALEGTRVDAPIAELRAADLMFFSDGDGDAISHVGIALGGSRMAHLGLGRGGFAIERLDNPADPYVARLLGRFRTARRLFSAGRT